MRFPLRQTERPLIRELCGVEATKKLWEGVGACFKDAGSEAL